MRIYLRDDESNVLYMYVAEYEHESRESHKSDFIHERYVRKIFFFRDNGKYKGFNESKEYAKLHNPKNYELSDFRHYNADTKGVLCL